ncbi:hypothetical protein EGI32_04305 [Ferruginibacter sp. HRS2-29]|nr:hypothetical protein [Ferruginibacter sp. HRS2-29]
MQIHGATDGDDQKKTVMVKTAVSLSLSKAILLIMSMPSTSSAGRFLILNISPKDNLKNQNQWFSTRNHFGCFTWVDK